MRQARLSKMVAILVSLAVSLPAQENAQNPAAVAAFRAGQEAFQKEDFDAAIAQFKAAAAADPRLAAAHCALGQAYMMTRRYAEAVDALVLCKSATEVPAGPTRVIFSPTLQFGGTLTPCGTLTGSHPELRPNEAITVSVSGLVVNAAFCADQYQVRAVRVSLQQAGGPQILTTGTAFLPDLPLTFSIVP